jgi:hypothetical protein
LVSFPLPPFLFPDLILVYELQDPYTPR